MWIILVSFFSGSLVFSHWIGKLFLKQDITALGDGNPGATNVIRAGGIALGILALLLDYSKGFLPVLYAVAVLRVEGMTLVAAALAPVLGHAFSPFLKGRGGKAVAVTFGVWSGLTLWRVPVIMGAAMLVFSLVVVLSEDGWKVMFSKMTVFFYLWFFPPDFSWQLVWTGNILILAIRHRKDLTAPLFVKKGIWGRVGMKP